MSLSSKLSVRRSTGFSLVEIMVGLAIGMLAVIVILQVFALSEGRKRTATSGGDAQSNGAVMLYQLQRDISQAGYGMSAASLFNCNVTWTVASGSALATAIPLAPVTINPSLDIIPAGDVNTDRVLVMTGNTNGQPQGNVINNGTTIYTVQMPSAFAVGDRVIAVPAACGAANMVLTRITVAPPTTANTVTVATGAGGTVLYNLGQAPTVSAYAIRGGNLTVCDYMINDCGLLANTDNPSIWVPLAPDIVSMKAQYARDTTAVMDAIPDVYDQTTPTTGCGWARTSAIRLALVARSSQYEKELVTTTAINTGNPVNAPTWAGNATAPIVAAAGTLGPNAAIDEPWKHYRYKVFQTIVPIRNVAWMGVPKECV
ncbi:PilW family protein [Herminiimonas arsenitoxidans]|uniref:PilW family protein n=1 Tax=Herminiimonas arsenitoxidans TaxID=1809410 RepID=UPI0012FF7042|nr:PilW family protein [Herminiimonas arsenitoxidans]